jgi:hypothetical protein
MARSGWCHLTLNIEKGSLGKCGEGVRRWICELSVGSGFNVMRDGVGVEANR